MRAIISDPEILGGKPVVDGTRLSVEHILGLLSNGMSPKKIIKSYPELTESDINEVIGYAARALNNDVFIEIRSGHGV